MQRYLKFRVNWQDVWASMRQERMRKPKITYDKDFFKGGAELFSRQIRRSGFEYGQNACDLLKEILEPNFNVLEIGPGPGTLTIPLAKAVAKIEAVESAAPNVRELNKNLKNENLHNVEVVQADWNQFGGDKIKNRFDLVVCSHFLWQIEDLKDLLHKMEGASRRYCAIIQPAGRDAIVANIFTALSDIKYSGQFEPDADYFVYVVLREWGRTVEVHNFEYTLERDLEEETKYIAGFLGRFMEVDAVIAERIRAHLANISKEGKFSERSRAVVFWWNPEL